MARAADPHIIQVMAGLGAEYDVVLVAGSDGRLAADVRPLVRLSLTVIAESQGRREMGHGGGGGRTGLAYFTDDLLRGYVQRAVHEALTNLEARQLGSAQCGESVGQHVWTSGVAVAIT